MGSEEYIYALRNYNVSDPGIGQMGLRHKTWQAKGKGYFGVVPSGDGNFSTEISAEDGRGEFPLMVPTLTKQELGTLLSNGDVGDETMRKAQSWADVRRSMGLSPFSQRDELRISTPIVFELRKK